MITNNAKMAVGLKLKLASLPRTRCTKCGSVKSYTNPMAKCFECKKKFCFDDINCLQFKKGMKQTDELRDVCDACKDKYSYQHFSYYR